jgi:hypothetical protein
VAIQHPVIIPKAALLTVCSTMCLDKTSFLHTCVALRYLSFLSLMISTDLALRPLSNAA